MKPYFNFILCKEKTGEQKESERVEIQLTEGGEEVNKGRHEQGSGRESEHEREGKGRKSP